MADELRGTVALVTGAGRGIGRAIAQAYAVAGAAVTVMARSADELRQTAAAFEANGGRVLALSGDVADRTRVEQVVSETVAAFGSIDVLVNNAGVAARLEPFWESDPDDWWRVTEVNLRGVMQYTRFVLPGMLARGRGRIINVASGVALQPVPLSSAYATSKAAVLRFTDSIAAGVRDRGISLFAVSPGDVQTAMAEQVQQDLERLGRGRTPQWLPVARMTDLCLALATGQADQLSGRFIHVTDDLQALVKRADEIEQEVHYQLRLTRLASPEA